MNFRTDIPENDAQAYLSYMDGLESEVNTEQCDCCLNRSEEFRIAPDGKCFCCVDCIGNGKAKEFYLEHESEEVINNWLEALKVK